MSPQHFSKWVGESSRCRWLDFSRLDALIIWNPADEEPQTLQCTPLLLLLLLLLFIIIIIIIAIIIYVMEWYQYYSIIKKIK